MSAAAAPKAAGEAAEPRWLGLSKTAVALVSALVALAVSIPTGIYAVWPSLSPDPKTTVDAKLETLVMDANVTYEDYLARSAGQPIHGATPNDYGNVFYIRAFIKGFKREELRVRWYTYDATNRTRLNGLGSTKALEQILRPEAPVNTQIAEVWVPTPSTDGTYFVRFELYAHGSTLLSFVDSDTFLVQS